MQLTKKQQSKHDEITQYVLDLERVTKLRDHAAKTGDMDEAGRYDTAIEVMQLCLVHLNERLTNHKHK